MYLLFYLFLLSPEVRVVGAVLPDNFCPTTWEVSGSRSTVNLI